MSALSPKALLQQHSLKSTPARRSILRQLSDQEGALTVQDLEAKIDSDRITIYRTLQSFEEKGLVHRIQWGGAADRFALCDPELCASGVHHHNHAHFTCTTCDTTRCLANDAVKLTIQVNDTMHIDEVQINVSGTCSQCTTAQV